VTLVSPPVDLTNCDREPIHMLGAIQPIGFLVALTQDWLVARASANAEQFLGVPAEAMIGRPATEFFTAGSIHAMRNRLAVLRGGDAVERLFGCTMVENQGPFDIAIHMSGGTIIVEAEPRTDEDHADASNTVRSMMGRLDQSIDMEAFLREGARQVKALTGYDRVMVYRFAPSGAGEVIAEAVRPGIGAFLGLHYPPSDIPAQARELYRRNLLRVIADVDAQPVAIVPAADATGRPLDLSLSVLRSVSPIHIEYLRNMGVRASMSISIIVEGRLWGLFACHHYAPRALSFERRSVAELFAQMFSMRLESRERQQIGEIERRARQMSDQLLGAVASDENLLNSPEWLRDILTGAIPADGVGVWIDGAYSCVGATPPPGDFAEVVRALNTTAAGQVYATDHIASLLPGAERFASHAAGLLAIPISRKPRDYVILFRSELVRAVRWGGDPYKPVEYGPNGPRLTPRASFEEWKELVEHHSRPFTAAELRVAETLRGTMIEVVLRLTDEASQQRQQANERQEVLIAELNHRVRNILGLIRGLIRQSKPTGGSIDDFVALIDGRIHALARAHNQITDDHWGPAPLRALIDAEAAAFLGGRIDRIQVRGPRILLNPQAYSSMALVFHELVTNSAKYGALSDHGRVLVEWERDAGDDLAIRWREDGGPPVKKPNRKGFGSTIIERSIPYDLGGTARSEYHPDGFRAWFNIPGRHVFDAGDEEAPAERIEEIAAIVAAEIPDQILAGKTVLLVEDSLIIALDAEDILRRLGAEEVLISASAEGGIAELARARPAIGLLDINLGERTSFPAADALRARGIPYFFATGYGEQALLPDIHQDVPVVQKPYTLANLARVIAALIGAREPVEPG
jgi:light-regulated signal transduction histidine kinase (bacteriophytochrome)/CheY-like chemotaxis protein